MPAARGMVMLTYDKIVDFLIARPSATRMEVAQTFGYTPEGIGFIIKSDAFQTRMNERRAELVDPLIQAKLDDRLNELAHASLDILQRKLTNSDDPKLALASLDAVSKAKGYGAQNAPQMQNTFVVHLPGPAASTEAWQARFNNALPAPV